ncbi:MAG: hypothetical protein ABR866_21275 [Candidatus Korobacteraceae bacterium]|jgi:hypothetical protein
MSWRNDNNRSFEQPASETPKARISIQSVVTPVVSAILVVIIISFKEWAKSSPWLTGLLFLLFVLLNFYPKIRGRVLNWQKDRSVQREQAAFVKHWQAEFDRLQLLRRLKEFENPTMALSIMKVPAKCNMKAWESNSAMMFEPGGGPLPGGLYELDLSDLNQRTLADLKTPSTTVL